MVMLTETGIGYRIAENKKIRFAYETLWSLFQRQAVLSELLPQKSLPTRPPFLTTR